MICSRSLRVSLNLLRGTTLVKVRVFSRALYLTSVPLLTRSTVDAKSKFLGKSFEIRPTGVAHVKLRIPEAWAPDAPPAVRTPGLVTEHYSWTKVTTSVSNFLFGNPIIDHYGDMVRPFVFFECVIVNPVPTIALLRLLPTIELAILVHSHLNLEAGAEAGPARLRAKLSTSPAASGGISLASGTHNLSLDEWALALVTSLPTPRFPQTNMRRTSGSGRIQRNLPACPSTSPLSPSPSTIPTPI